VRPGSKKAKRPDWQRLIERREDYRIGTVPPGGLLLVGGADVQKDRIEVSIWAFGRGKESWLVEHRVLMGDTARDAVWKRLAELLAERWTHASGCGDAAGSVSRWTPALPRRRPMRLCVPAVTRA
jgi:phage terminase large subunit GpA-like protein